MLSILMAITVAGAPAGVPSAALGPCAPNKHTACEYPSRAKASRDIPVGKRCHPDPTKSFGCREILADSKADRAKRVAAED